MEEFDGRALDPGRSFDALAPERWLVTEAGADVSGLTAAARTATDRGEPLIVLATAFALVALLDVLGERTLPTGSDTVIMQTGGFKGHVRAIEPDQLLSRVAAVFGIDEARVVGEYGMTELTSQLYEPVLADSALGRENRLRGRARVYVPPPWLRVTAVHPETLQPLPTGQIGLARFVDLANIDSAVAVLTQDLVRARDSGVELMGRYAGAPLRGCSLALESLLAR
jgi:acyl-CoA synthetase (AMP-forming)/AMP-acid ligase II